MNKGSFLAASILLILPLRCFSDEKADKEWACNDLFSTSNYVFFIENACDYEHTDSRRLLSLFKEKKCSISSKMDREARMSAKQQAESAINDRTNQNYVGGYYSFDMGMYCSDNTQQKNKEAADLSIERVKHPEKY